MRRSIEEVLRDMNAELKDINGHARYFCGRYEVEIGFYTVFSHSAKETWRYIKKAKKEVNRK